MSECPILPVSSHLVGKDFSVNKQQHFRQDFSDYKKREEIVTECKHEIIDYAGTETFAKERK